jgi:hypothetical protein
MERRQHLAVEIGVQAVFQLHQMGVGVVHDTVLHIGHEESSEIRAI